MQTELKLASTDAEREALYRLRYEIYVEEMGIFGAVADHERRRFIDPHDATARLMYATADDAVIGTLRLNFGADAPFSDEFVLTYGLDRFRPVVSDAQMVVLTRFMVRKDVRGTPLPFHMISEAARITMAEGAEIALCDCQPHLINLYSRLGFRSYDCPVYNDPEFGIMVPLAFIMGDLDYLQRIRSPLRAVMAQRPEDAETTRRILARLGTAAVRSTKAEEAADHWSDIYGLLNERAASTARLFDGLSEDEVQAVAARGHVIECAPGDRIIRQGQPARTVFVVLSGSLEVRSEDHLIGVKTPGDVVGELAFLLARRRTADVYAGAEGARVLSLDEQKFRQFVETPSHTAAQVLLNLSKVLALKLAETTALLRSSNDLPGFEPGL